MEKMQPVVVLPFYFSNKRFVRYVAWKEEGFSLDPKIFITL